MVLLDFSKKCSLNQFLIFFHIKPLIETSFIDKKHHANLEVPGLNILLVLSWPHFRIICEPGLHGHFWVLQFWQINKDPKRSPHANLEVSGINNIKDLFWPLNWALSSTYLSLEVKTLISGPRCCCPIYIWPLECSKLINGGQRTEIGG